MGQAFSHDRQFANIFGRDPEEERLAEEREKERRKADALAMHHLANLQMPEDMKQRAKEWGLEAFMEAVWLNAFQCGYRQAVRFQNEQTHKEQS